MGTGSRSNASSSPWREMDPKPLRPFDKLVLVGIVLLSAFAFLNELYLGRPPNIPLLIGLFAVFVVSTFFLLRTEGML